MYPWFPEPFVQVREEGGGGDDDGGLLGVECLHGGPAPAGLGGLPSGVQRNEVFLLELQTIHQF